MSRVTKFLRQTCELERYVLKNGKPELNDFGELQYARPVTTRCRREESHKDVQLANGSIVRVTSVYYFDDSQEIKSGYRINGSVVVQVVSLTSSAGRVEGYEVYV